MSQIMCIFKVVITTTQKIMKQSYLLWIAILFLYCSSAVYSAVPDIRNFYANQHFNITESVSGINIAYDKENWENFTYKIDRESFTGYNVLSLNIRVPGNSNLWIGILTEEGEKLVDYQKYVIEGESDTRIQLDLSELEQENMNDEYYLLTFYPDAGEKSVSNIMISSIELDSEIMLDLGEEEKPQLHVYPNPATNFVMLSNLSGSTLVKLFDIAGRELQSIAISEAGECKIKMEQYPSGNYLLISSNKNQVFQSIISKK